MAEREHSVVYRAIAEFDDARKKAKEFRDELRALKAEQEGLNKSSSSSAQQSEQAERRLTSATNERTKATQQSARATRESTEEIRKLGNESEKTSAKFRSIQSIGRNFGSEFSKSLGSLASEMRKAWREAEAGETAFQKLRRAMSAAGGSGGGTGFFTTLAGGADNLGRSITSLLSKFTFWPTVILAAAAAAGPLVAILGSLGAVALGAGSALISLAGSVAALPGAIFAAATGIGALVTAISPLGGALKAYQAAQEASATASKSAGKAQSDQANQIRSASRAVEQAQHSVVQSAQALQDAHAGVARAAHGVEEAEYNLAEAQRDAKRAQQEVNEARQEALRDLQDLRREVDRSGLSEERAVLNLVRAQQELAKVQSDPTSSLIDRREALLRVREAENDLSDVRRKNAENAQELSKAEAAGVEGSKKVIDAKENAASAAKRQQDAEYALAEAQRGVSDALRQVAEAEYRLSESRRNVIDAEQRLGDAQRGTATGASAAATAQAKYQAALEKLSPAARSVLGAVIDLQKSWEGVSRNVQQALFEPVVKDLKLLPGLLKTVEGLLVDSAGAIGDVADEGLRMISSGPWKKDFADQSKANAVYIKNIGDAGLYLLDALRNITRAADPFTRWLTGALKQGAANFRDWSASARNSGDIARFLDVTKRRLQEVWEVTKNVGGTLLSWGKAAQPFTDWMMARLIDITQRWRDVAREQEKATSPLQKWLVDVRPLLSEVGGLLGDIARGFANAAKDTSNIERAINLLQSLRKDVLPAISRILRELGESGVDQDIVNAISEILDAIATFLDSGGGHALSTFVTVLAGFVSVLANIAALPGVSQIIGGIATALAAVAAVSIVTRFSGLFKLVDAFRWFVQNRGNITGALGDAARGVVGLQKSPTGNATTPAIIPTVTNSIGPIGSEVIGQQARDIEKTGNAARDAAPRVGVFSRAVSGISSAGGAAKGALSNLVGFLGGPWGIALTAATIGIGLLAGHLSDQRKEAQDTKDAFQALKNAYGDLSQGNTDQVKELSTTNDKFKDITEKAQQYRISLTDIAGALNGHDQNLSRVNAQLDTQITAYENLRIAAVDAGGPTAALPYKKLKDDAIEFKNSINEVADAQTKSNELTKDTIGITRTYEERLGGLTQEQVDNAVEVGNLQNKITTLSSALDTLSSATATSSDRSKALSDIINYQNNEFVSANEATENFQESLLNFTDTIESNRDSVGKHGDALATNTKAGLRNRDALEAAAKSVRDLFLADIASGVPMDNATKKHQDRITALKEEAKRLGLNKTETEKLIKAYGDVPEDIKTNIKTDDKGFSAVYVELSRLAVMQKALQEGKSLSAAQNEWNKESSKFYERYIPGKNYGDGYGIQSFAEGGSVWGAGTRKSDSIRAWLSNGEFVQPTDTVDYYGRDVMEAMRKRQLDKSVFEGAMPNNTGFNNGGLAHGSSCSACASGSAHKYASGGSVTFPFVVNPRNTKIDKDWATGGDGADLGGGAGGNGYKWQMGVLRAAFPGLTLLSGYRPNAHTLSGNLSYHARGRAVDVPARRDVAKWINEHYGRQTKELITPWNDLNIWNGKRHTYTGDIYAQHAGTGRFKGNAHDHWAFRDGGMVDLASMFGFPGLDTASMLSNAAMPNATSRQLSAAAQSVINQDRGITVQNLNVNNPVPERASDSLARQVSKLAVLGDI